MSRREKISIEKMISAMNTPKKNNSQALIAIVDDDQSFREALASLIKLLGFRSTIFASARDFLASPKLSRVSCVALDVSMTRRMVSNCNGTWLRPIPFQ
jgi:DNA-binding NtrC family response regulator